MHQPTHHCLCKNFWQKYCSDTTPLYSLDMGLEWIFLLSKTKKNQERTFCDHEFINQIHAEQAQTYTTKRDPESSSSSAYSSSEVTDSNLIIMHSLMSLVSPSLKPFYLTCMSMQSLHWTIHLPEWIILHPVFHHPLWSARSHWLKNISLFVFLLSYHTTFLTHFAIHPSGLNPMACFFFRSSGFHDERAELLKLLHSLQPLPISPFCHLCQTKGIVSSVLSLLSTIISFHFSSISSTFYLLSSFPSHHMQTFQTNKMVELVGG